MVSISILVLLTVSALVKAERNYSDAFPMPDPVVPHISRPHGIPSGRITGGVESVPHSRPYQVILFLPVPEGLSFCGGSLITLRTILTAAHCVDELVGPVEVVLGAHSIAERESGQVRLSSSQIIIHPEWDDEEIRNDVALIILPQEVQLNENIQLVKLADESHPDLVGHQATVSGWGRTSDLSNVISPVLMEVQLPIISNGVCNIAYLGQIQGNQICASGLGGRSSCNGDSGGPLVVDDVQVGIVSFGIIFGCEVGFPSVYARVSSYRSWINANSV